MIINPRKMVYGGVGGKRLQNNVEWVNSNIAMAAYLLEREYHNQAIQKQMLMSLAERKGIKLSESDLDSLVDQMAEAAKGGCGK